MKTVVALWIVLSVVLWAEVDLTAWRWEAPFEIRQPGMVRLAVPPAVLDVSRADLGDLRVVSPMGETPFLVERPTRGEGAVMDAGDFKLVRAGRSMVIECAVAGDAKIEAVDLVSPAREFLKPVRVEGRMDSGEWRVLAQDQVIFRQSGGPERLRIPIVADAWRGLKITVDDGREQPVPFTGVRLISAAEKPETEEVTLPPGQRQELAGETRLALDLEAANLDVAEIRLELPDAVFSRFCHLSFSLATPEGGTRMEKLASATLYRVAGENGTSVEELVIPVHRRIPSRMLVVAFRNGDSPPLKISGAKVRYYPTVLAIHAATAGDWKLFTGESAVNAPQYDLSPLREAMAKAGGRRVTAGALRENPDFIRHEALPGVETDGKAIDLTRWSRTRTVSAARPGVIRIELDAMAIAGCRTDFGDIRLVRNGRQVPYLFSPGSVMRDLKAADVSLKPDPKRPTVSRWEIKLPVDGLPVVNLSASSPAGMFSRRFVALVERSDELGNHWTEQAGAADWSKCVGRDASLSIQMEGGRLPEKFMLETDHGDNPPMDVENVSVRFAAPVLIAKLTDPSEILLCYGNPKATPPQYDLRLVSEDLLAAAAQTAILGEERVTKPDAPDRHGLDAGSPWLWLALGGAVATLLVIVAKLLPKPTSP